MEADVTSADERRATLRLGAEDHGIDAAAIRPGHRARVLDVSRGGALVETHFRLLPGSSVELVVQVDNQRVSSRGRDRKSVV